MKVRSALLALAATSLLLVAGCSSDGSDGGSDSTDEVTTSAPAGDNGDTTPPADGAPATAELSAGIQEGFGSSADQADCAAEKVAGAGLSAESLQAIADADSASLPEDESQAVAEALQAALAECA